MRVIDLGRRSHRRPYNAVARWRCLFLAILVLSAAVVDVARAQNSSTLGGTRVRKNVTALTAAERKSFVGAVLALKRARSPYDKALNYYDQFVRWHKDRYVCHPADHAEAATLAMVHAGPMFLPWHRELLRRFEDALRQVNGKNIAVPYWDWTDRESVNLDNPRSVFRDDFMGGSGDSSDRYAVTTGPFRRSVWTLNVHPEGAFWAPSKTQHLTRNLGNVRALPTQADVDVAFAADKYDVAPFNLASDRARSFRNALEGEFASNTMACGDDGWMRPMPAPAGMPGTSTRFTLHNLVHPWVGGVISLGDPRTAMRGTMILSTSPNDPVFFLHHANVDRLWAMWQARHPGETYEPKSGQPANSADSPMTPFGRVTPRDVESIATLGYRYD